MTEENKKPGRPVTGLAKGTADIIAREILQNCSLIEPCYMPAAEMGVSEGADILVLWIPGGNDRPYKCPVSLQKENFGRPEKAYYIRKEAKTVMAEKVDKPDPTGIGMTEKIFTGPLDFQLRNALQYIQSYIIRERVTKFPDRAEAERMFNYPYTAVKEALTNAVLHKSYQIPEPITVTVTPDKMEITSLPGPDSSIPSEDIASRKMVSARCRNRRIGDFLKALGLAGERNTGIPAMLQAMKHNGSAPPVFKTNDERTFFTVILPVHRAFLAQKRKPQSESTADVRFADRHAGGRRKLKPPPCQAGRGFSFKCVCKRCLCYQTIKYQTSGASKSLYTAKGTRDMRPTRAIKPLIASRAEMKDMAKPTAIKGISAAVNSVYDFSMS